MYSNYEVLKSQKPSTLSAKIILQNLTVYIANKNPKNNLIE